MNVAPRPEVLQALERHQAGDLAGAHRGYQQVLREHPDDVHAHLWLGALLQQTGRSEQAEHHLEQATRLAPALPDGWVNLGVVRQALGRIEDAETAFRTALDRDPGLDAAWLGLGNALQVAGRIGEAEDAYRRARDLAPDNALAAFNLATLLAADRRFEAAIEAGQAALATNPELVEAHALVADCLVNLGQAERALDTTHQGLAVAPGDAGLHYTRGFAAAELGRLGEARDAFDAALAADPDHGGALAAALFTRRQLCDWNGTERLLTRFREGVTRGLPGLTPFSFLAEAVRRDEHRDCARAWSRQWPGGERNPDMPLPGAGTGRLTIGYLSADYYRHPTAYLAAGLFEHHDRDRFRVIAYSNSRDDDSPIRHRLEASFDEFVDLRNLSLEAAVERIRRDGVDILVDLKGHTLEAATGILAHRAAPIQVQYLGYPGTLGAPFVDYVLGDAVVTPQAHAGEYDEAIVQLPDSYQVNDDQRPLPPPTDRRTALGLPEDGVVFCCFNNAWKINPACFDAWMAILRETPDSVLWLLGRQSSQEVATHLRREARDRQVDPARLVFSKSRPLAAYLALYHHADLFLDSWPYNAHTTASDALWMGCPVLTLETDAFPGRVGASLLRAVGLEELVCREVTQFQERASALAGDRPRLRELRRHLVEGRTRHPLFDTARTTRALERAYEEMAERHAGSGPAFFRVDP